MTPEAYAQLADENADLRALLRATQLELQQLKQTHIAMAQAHHKELQTILGEYVRYVSNTHVPILVTLPPSSREVSSQ